MTIALFEQTEEAGGPPGALIAAWLSGLFMAPLPIDAVADYCSSGGARLLEVIGAELGCKPGIDRMRSALTVNVSPTSIARELAIAYTLLFDGVAGPGTVSLYESAYSGTGGRLFQKAAGDMELLLQGFGLSVSEDCCEPPDHLSIELALLSTVLRGNDGDCVASLRDRLLAWVPEFARRCDRVDRSGFYCGAAMVLNDLLRSPALRDPQCVE
jgi:TorA specific chaperone